MYLVDNLLLNFEGAYCLIPLCHYSNSCKRALDQLISDINAKLLLKAALGSFTICVLYSCYSFFMRQEKQKTETDTEKMKKKKY